MPSGYAHYRFGAAILQSLPADIRRSTQRFRRLYDVGLHGPDLFYYYKPVSQSSSAMLGVKYHEQTGKAFFTRVCRAIRLERSEAASAALYGVLCHYVLDSKLHPIIARAAQETGLTELQIETEFDRCLLGLDGKLPPDGARLTGHLKLTDGECETLAKFYPPANGKAVRKALNATALYTRLSATPNGPGRALLEAGIHIVGSQLQGMLLSAEPDPKCAPVCQELLEMYRQTIDAFPVYLQQIQANMTYSAPLEEEFSPTFAGI